MKTCKHPNCSNTIQPSSQKKIFCSPSCATGWHNNVRGKWQGLQTIPKDGSKILIYNSSYPIYIASYLPGEDSFIIADRVGNIKVCPTNWLSIPPLPKT